MASRQLRYDDLKGGARLAWLLDVTWAGRVFRFSSEPLEVSSADGALLYDGGLINEVEVELGYAVLDQEPEFPSVSVELDFGALDVARKVLQGHPLRGAAAELSLYVIGTVYEDRWRVVRGRLNAPEIGQVGEPVSASLEEVRQQDPTPSISPDATVTPTSWPDARDDAVGQAYPLPFGTPGTNDDTLTAGSPALPVNVFAAITYAEVVDTLLICDGVCDASSVTILVPANTYTNSGGAETALTRAVTFNTISQVQDGNGRTVSVVDISAPGMAGGAPEYLVFLTSASFWAIWDSGGSLPSAADGSPIVTGGSLLEHAALLSSAEYDEPQIRTVAQRLNGIPVAGYLNDPGVTWTDFLADNLLPLIPYSLVWTPDGLQLLSWGLDAKAVDAVAAIEAGVASGVVRASGMVEVEHPAYRSASLKYARKADSGGFGRRTTYEPYAIAPSHGSAHADHVASSRDDAEDWSSDTDILHTQQGAHYVLRNTLKLGASTVLETDYVATTEWLWLPLGSIVTLTDEELGYDTLPSVLSRLVLRLDGPGLTFTTILDPVASLPLLPS